MINSVIKTVNRCFKGLQRQDKLLEQEQKRSLRGLLSRNQDCFWDFKYYKWYVQLAVTVQDDIVMPSCENVVIKSELDSLVGSLKPFVCTFWNVLSTLEKSGVYFGFAKLVLSLPDRTDKLVLLDSQEAPFTLTRHNPSVLPLQLCKLYVREFYSSISDQEEGLKVTLTDDYFEDIESEIFTFKIDQQ